VIGSVSPVGMLHELRERIYAPHGQEQQVVGHLGELCNMPSAAAASGEVLERPGLLLPREDAEGQLGRDLAVRLPDAAWSLRRAVGADS
jgi:hypothetical protein